MENARSFSGEVEFSLVHFLLEFQESFHFGVEEFLRLRRDLLKVAGRIFGSSEAEQFKALFAPPLAADPEAVRRFQRPSPPFAVLAHSFHEQGLDAGDQIELTVSFWGRGCALVGNFAQALQALGQAGFHRGQGIFELVAIFAEDASGNRERIWKDSDRFQHLAPPVNEAGWWLDRTFEPSMVVIDFITPARLISKDRPLFKLDFRRLFPFVLRRATSMVYAHCGCEVVDEPKRMLAAANEVEEVENSLYWKDWHALEGRGLSQDIGGILGSIRLTGRPLQEIYWILKLGSLLNVGKGAAFGAGCFRLKTDSGLLN